MKIVKMDIQLKTFIAYLLSLLPVVMICALLTGCGGSSEETSQTKTPVVEYIGANGDSSAVNIDNYRNADWLFQNYLGEYGLPEELKPLVYKELRMLANGFALQHARGQDVAANIAQINTSIQMFNATGQMETFVQSMIVDYNKGLIPDPPSPSEISQPEDPDDPKGYLKTEDEEKRRMYKQWLQEDKEDYDKQMAVVEKYNLPYPLHGKLPKYLIYSQSMKGGGSRGGGGGSKKAPRNDGSGDKNDSKKKKHNIANWKYYNGDILYAYNGFTDHMGIVDVNVYVRKDEAPHVIDANLPGVRRHTDLNRWADGYKKVHGYYVRVPRRDNLRDNACYHNDLCKNGWFEDTRHSHRCDNKLARLDHSWAYRDCDHYNDSGITKSHHRDFENGRRANEKRYNKAVIHYVDALIGVLDYSVFQRDSSEKTYCSQLIWRAYYHVYGISLDRDGGFWVFPKDIRDHEDTFFFAYSKV